MNTHNYWEPVYGREHLKCMKCLCYSADDCIAPSIIQKVEQFVNVLSSPTLQATTCEPKHKLGHQPRRHFSAAHHSDSFTIWAVEFRGKFCRGNSICGWKMLHNVKLVWFSAACRHDTTNYISCNSAWHFPGQLHTRGGVAAVLAQIITGLAIITCMPSTNFKSAWIRSRYRA